MNTMVLAALLMAWSLAEGHTPVGESAQISVPSASPAQRAVMVRVAMGGMGMSGMGMGGMTSEDQGNASESQTGPHRGRGGVIYDRSCVACHGADGTGAILGAPDLTRAKGPLAKPDRVLLKHIKDGFQSPGSSAAMPPKGGNPDLTDSDIRAVIQYMRQAFKGY
jgi:cytochrome c5